MTWLTLSKKFSELSKFRVKRFLFCFSLRIGVICASVLTITHAIVLFVIFFSSRDSILPENCRFFSGLFASPFFFLGTTLTMACFKPKKTILESYVLGTQALILLFPIPMVGSAGRAYVIAYRSTFEMPKFISFVLYLSLSYLAMFYHVTIVLSFKDQLPIQTQSSQHQMPEGKETELRKTDLETTEKDPPCASSE